MPENKTDRTANEEAGKVEVDVSKYDDHFPDPERFNAAIAEASSDIDETAFDEDFLIENDDDPLDPFETLPEWEIVEHNLGI